ncbi:MAG: hypothetical protein KAS32_07665 [Candidatus Peribacteraceae bacterium]|nr:hypothetical protein [Candidatus Peribacteraceae bacterium]
MSIMTSKRIYHETGICPICRNTKGMYEQIKKLEKQSDMLALGILQEKNRAQKLKEALQNLVNSEKKPLGAEMADAFDKIISSKVY